MATLDARPANDVRAHRESFPNAPEVEAPCERGMAGTVNPLGARRQKTDLHISEPTVTRSQSPAPSLRSQRAKQYRASLPVRTARLLQRSRAHTPSSDGGGGGAGGTGGAEGGAASPAPATATLLQDVVDIKTLLLQLKRVLHESETLDPLLTCADPARGNGRRLPSPAHPAATLEHTADLRRQILYLQSQVEERDRLVRVLQQQMSRLTDAPHPALHPAPPDDTCNVATQTDRLRPPVATNLSHNENSGLVSWNELNGRKLSTYSEAQIKTKRVVANGTLPAKCQCGRRINGAVNGSDSEPPQLKPGGRVSSRYLQALSRDQPDRQRRDLSVNERLPRYGTFGGARSRSIENFHKQNLSEPRRSDRGSDSPESHLKHYTSHSDLSNGRVGNSNGHSPTQNGQSTDTDYSSDGGYKSLPTSMTNGSPKKVSGIPRRSIEARLFTSKPSIKASAI